MENQYFHVIVLQLMINSYQIDELKKVGNNWNAFSLNKWIVNRLSQSDGQSVVHKKNGRVNVNINQRSILDSIQLTPNQFGINQSHSPEVLLVRNI